MSERQDDTTGENDYIEQLQWQASFRKQWPVRFMPKWKYRIGYQNREPSLGERIFRWLMLIGIVVVIIYMLVSFVRYGDTGKAILFGFIFMLIGIILFFAVRDISNKKDEDTEE